MNFLIPERRRYRPRLFWWWDFETVATAIMLMAFFWFFMVGLPLLLPDGLRGVIALVPSQ